MVWNRVPAPPREALGRGDGLPTLVPGRDRLPTVCSHCGSGMLDREPPLGPHQRGMLWCQMCSRSLCWLAAPLAAVPHRAVPHTVSGARAAVREPLRAVRRRILGGRYARGAGCGVACTVDYGHDTVTHEQYGADAAYAELRSRRSGDVVTGCLLVQLGPGRVYVNGCEVGLAHLQFEILAHFADRLGDVCAPSEVACDVWERAYTTGAPSNVVHTMRVYVARLRATLGPAASLIETETGRGYRLADVPPC